MQSNKGDYGYRLIQHIFKDNIDNGTASIKPLITSNETSNQIKTFYKDYEYVRHSNTASLKEFTKLYPGLQLESETALCSIPSFYQVKFIDRKSIGWHYRSGSSPQCYNTHNEGQERTEGNNITTATNTTLCTGIIETCNPSYELDRILKEESSKLARVKRIILGIDNANTLSRFTNQQRLRLSNDMANMKINCCVMFYPRSEEMYTPGLRSVRVVDVMPGEAFILPESLPHQGHASMDTNSGNISPTSPKNIKDKKMRSTMCRRTSSSGSSSSGCGSSIRVRGSGGSSGDGVFVDVTSTCSVAAEVADNASKAFDGSTITTSANTLKQSIITNISNKYRTVKRPIVKYSVEAVLKSTYFKVYCSIPVLSGNGTKKDNIKKRMIAHHATSTSTDTKNPNHDDVRTSSNYIKRGTLNNVVRHGTTKTSSSDIDGFDMVFRDRNSPSAPPSSKRKNRNNNNNSSSSSTNTNKLNTDRDNNNNNNNTRKKKKNKFMGFISKIKNIFTHPSKITTNDKQSKINTDCCENDIGNNKELLVDDYRMEYDDDDNDNDYNNNNKDKRIATMIKEKRYAKNLSVMSNSSDSSCDIDLIFDINRYGVDNTSTSTRAQKKRRISSTDSDRSYFSSSDIDESKQQYLCGDATTNTTTNTSEKSESWIIVVMPVVPTNDFEKSPWFTSKILMQQKNHLNEMLTDMQYHEQSTPLLPVCLFGIRGHFSSIIKDIGIAVISSAIHTNSTIPTTKSIIDLTSLRILETFTSTSDISIHEMSESIMKDIEDNCNNNESRDLIKKIKLSLHQNAERFFVLKEINNGEPTVAVCKISEIGDSLSQSYGMVIHTRNISRKIVNLLSVVIDSKLKTK